MSYVDSLSSKQKKNIDVLLEELNNAGITNPISQAGILAIISKESAFEPKDENMNYSANRLMEVFGLSASKANSLAYKPEAIANYVYGNKNGNTASGDGWKYRGRGFNGLTFKGNYKKYADIIGVDIVSNPTKVNEIHTASKIQSAYAKSNIDKLKQQGKLSAYNSSGINDFKDLKNSVFAFYHINAGVNKNVADIKKLEKSDTLGGMTKALARVDDLYQYIISKKKSSGKGSGLATGILLAVLFVSGWIAYRKYYNLPL